MPNSPLGPELDSTCETIVLEFERCRREGREFDLVDALEDIEPELRPRLAAELACIDLERSCDEGRLPVASAIVWKHTDLFASEAARLVVAIEHYRLCCVLGTTISREAIAKLYNVSLSEIPSRATNAGQARSKDIDFPVAGQVFCNYPLIAELGRGALARVYLAQQPDLAQRLVVLKVTQRLTAESDRLARLQHSGIIPVYSVHKQGDLTCICMPYLGALTLANLIDDGRLLSQGSESPLGLVSTIVSKRLSTIVNDVENARDSNLNLAEQNAQSVDSSKSLFVDSKNTSADAPHSAEQLSEQLGIAELIESLNSQVVHRGPVVATVELITKIAEALAYAHQRSIVHRDLKPENILIANDGQPILLDFNLSASVNESGCDIAGGTLPYMSPQHLRSLGNNGQASASDDVFSVGVLLYQLLSGKLPFESAPFAAQDLEKLAAGRANLPPSLNKLNTAIPKSLSSIVSKCLAYESRDRYPSATELVDDLQRYRSDRVLRYAPDRSPSERMRKWIRRHPTVTSNTSLLLCFGLVLCVLVSALMLSRSRAERLSAMHAAQSLPAEAETAIALLQSPGREPELLQEGIQNGMSALNEWLADDAGGLRLKPIINHLDAAEAESVKGQLLDLLRIMSSAATQLSIAQPTKRDGWLADVSKMDLMAELAKPRLGNLKKPEVIRVLFFEALSARDGKNFTLWRDLSEQMVASKPTDPSQWFTLGAAQWTLGEFESARHAFDVAVKLQPDSVVAQFWRGVCDLQLGNAQAAKSDFCGCLVARPNWVPAIYNRALAARLLGDNAAALADVKELIKNGHATTRVYGLQSQLELLLGDQPAALASRQRALDATPKDSEDWATRGMLQIPADASAALHDLQRALELNPTSALTLQNLAHIQSDIIHDYPAAIASLTQLIGLRPNSATPVASRGIILGREAQFTAAIEDAKTAETLKPNAIEMLQIAGIYSLACEGQQDRKLLSIAWLSKAIALNSAFRKVAATDPDLANLRDMEQFQALTDD